MLNEDSGKELTDAEKRAIDLMLAGAPIAGEETTLQAVESLYSRRGVNYARTQLNAPEM